MAWSSGLSNRVRMRTAKDFLQRFPSVDPVGDPLVLIPTFNNGVYLDNFLQQLRRRGINRFLILDGGSTEPGTVELLNRLDQEGHVVRLNGNPGPRYFFENKSFFESLPDIFCVSDPDLELNPSLPGDFLTQLHQLSLELKSGKIGFALSLEGELDPSEFFFGKRWVGIRDWESQFWKKRVHNSLGIEAYEASIDTTFALYNKLYLEKKKFFDAVRVAGVFCAKHIPWYPDHPLATKTPSATADSRFTTWSQELSEKNQKQALQFALKTVEDMRGSLSWRITAPLRLLHKVFRCIVTRLGIK